KETFFNELPALASASGQIHQAHEERRAEAAEGRCTAYEQALKKLALTTGWHELDEELQDEIAAPLRRRARAPEPSDSLAMLRENTHACPGILQNAIQRVLQSAATGDDPDILVVTDLVRGPITNEEQLEAALQQIRERAQRSLADGTPVILA